MPVCALRGARGSPLKKGILATLLKLYRDGRVDSVGHLHTAINIVTTVTIVTIVTLALSINKLCTRRASVYFHI